MMRVLVIGAALLTAWMAAEPASAAGRRGDGTGPLVVSVNGAPVGGAARMRHKRAANRCTPVTVKRWSPLTPLVR
jgi:hypothetical protein